jgi:hypothetical protein
VTPSNVTFAVVPAVSVMTDTCAPTPVLLVKKLTMSACCVALSCATWSSSEPSTIVLSEVEIVTVWIRLPPAPTSEFDVIVNAALTVGWKPAWLPSRRLIPLKLVFCEIRLTSSSSCETSACRLALSFEEVMSEDASIDSDRMRCRMSVTEFSAPSATLAALEAS